MDGRNPVHLFCLHFAGGNKYSLRPLSRHLHPGIAPCFLELPGRGDRTREAFIRDMDAAIDDLFLQIKAVLRPPYAFYGHSMGARLAFFLAKRVLAEGFPPPLHLFASGTAGPSKGYDKIRHRLSREDLFKDLGELGGIPEEILANQELMLYLEPLFRADFQLLETWRYENAGRLPLAITVITGTQEAMTEEEIGSWSLESSLAVNYMRLPGGHFFINQHLETLGRVISSGILRAHPQAIPAGGS